MAAVKYSAECRGSSLDAATLFCGKMRIVAKYLKTALLFTTVKQTISEKYGLK